MAPEPARQWLDRALMRGAHTRAAFNVFTHLPDAPPATLVGRWRGVPIATGHPLEPLLAGCGWYGKAFVDAETVFPLLCGDAGRYRVDPGRLPLRQVLTWPAMLQRPALRVFRASLPLWCSGRPGGRLRRFLWRGRTGTGLVYDRQPVIDHLRRVDEVTVLGLTDCRYTPRPLFFALFRG